ncbi:MAG: hypothetical protein SGILL_009058 [Bacillariaceae sp.]
MPPKDDQQRIELQQQQQQSTATSSPTSAASFFFHVQTTSSEGAAQREDASPPQTQQHYLELETPPTTTAAAPIEAIKLPSFRLLPRQPSSESSSSAPPQEVPAFLAFLNQLHGGDSTSSQEELSSSDNDEPSSTATQFGSSSASSSIAPVDRHVHFAEQPPQIHPTLSRSDYSSNERNNTWYTDRYLRISSQMHATDDDDADEDEVAHKAGHKRDLILAAARIRRARQAVMKEQSRTPYLSPGAKRRKEERIREAYHRATLQCQRDAKGRGDAAARVWEGVVVP